MTAAILRGSYNGLTWGQYGPGSPYGLVYLRGVEDLPPIESRDQPKVTADGMFPGTDRHQGEWPIFLSLRVAQVTGTDAAFRTLMDNVNAAFSKQAAVQALRFWNLERYVWARPRERTWSDYGAEMAGHSAIVTIRLVVVHPVQYVGVPGSPPSP